MQQKLVVSILIALVIALVFFNIGKITGSTISDISSIPTLTVFPEIVEQKINSKITFTVEPNNGKYYGTIDVYKKREKGLDEFIANLDVKTDYGYCGRCNKKGTAEFSTSGLANGDYYAEVLPLDSKNTVWINFSIMDEKPERKEWENY